MTVAAENRQRRLRRDPLSARSVIHFSARHAPGSGGIVIHTAIRKEAGSRVDGNEVLAESGVAEVATELAARAQSTAADLPVDAATEGE